MIGLACSNVVAWLKFSSDNLYFEKAILRQETADSVLMAAEKVVSVFERASSLKSCNENIQTR